MPTTMEKERRELRERQLQSEGYQPLCTKNCNYCGVMICWWRTPNGRKVAMDFKTLDCHFNACPRARKKVEAAAARRQKLQRNLDL